MFNALTLRQKFDSKEYEKLEEELRVKLFNLQRECEERGLAVLFTVSGVSCSGRGEIMNLLAKWLDNKKLRNHTFWRKSDEDKARPQAWRYWIKLPAKGEIACFFGGWYGEPIRLATCGELKADELYHIMGAHVERERTLTDNDYVIAKLWLHLDKKEHSKRRKEREKEEGQHHFTPYERESEEHYDELIETVGKVITMTDKDFSPWYIIDAYDKEFRNVTVAKALIEVIEIALEKKKSADLAKKKLADEDKAVLEAPSSGAITILDRVDLTKTIEKNEYKEELKILKHELSRLAYEAYKQGISSTLLFEGWDAAGKGGTIRRITSAVDARITQVIPISAPTDEELNHHYLWRFWRHVPMAGYITIYDRTWYGRVLVERVEGFSSLSMWKRAYAEINNFEEQLVENKNILLKFWLHISPEEQLRRFKEREETSWKRYKITDEDWRNREKADAYKIAADEMFMRTNTAYAPWHIIPAESKHFARIEVLKTYRDALNKALGKKVEESEHDLNLMTAEEVIEEQAHEANQKHKNKKNKK